MLGLQFYTLKRLPIVFYFETIILDAFEHLLLPKMAKYDVAKTRFPQNLLHGIFWNFDGIRKTDAE